MLDREPLVGTVGRLLALKRNPTLSGLPAGLLSVVAEYARDRLFPKGSVLLREGEPVESVFFVVAGRVHMTLRGRTLGDAGPGAGVGGFGFFARDPEGLGAVAETDVVALELDADRLLEIFEDNFPVLLHILRETCRELVRAARRVPGELAAKMPTVKGPADPLPELDLVERIFLLRQAPPFSRSSVSALAELAQGMAEIHFEPGVELWSPGEPSGSMVLIASGRVSCTSGEVSFELGPGTPAGALESVADEPRFYKLVTLEPVVALQGSVEILIDVFEDNFEMAMDYLSVMSRWLVDILDRLASGELERLYGCDSLPNVAAHTD